MKALFSRLLRRRTFRAALIVAALVVATFLVGDLLGVEDWMGGLLKSRMSPLAFALLVIGLLTADAALPVPSSLVVVASGSVLGFGMGSAVSFFGLILANLVGYAVGSRWPASDTPPKTSVWTWIALAATRCVPVAAETGAIVAGRERVPLGLFALASMVGSLPVALLLAYSGARLIEAV